MPDHKVELIDVDKIRPSNSKRRLDVDHAKALATNIKAIGLLQAIIVIALGDGLYKACVGIHRHHAFKLLGRAQIPARVLTPETDELVYSVVENSLCKNENIEDIVFRVEELARRLDLPFGKAAAICHIKPANFTRYKKITSKLTTEARQFADKNKFGMSVQYEVANRASTPELQLKAFQAVKNGLKRDQISDWFKEQSTPVAQKQKVTKLKLNVENIQVQLSVPSDSSYDEITHALKQIKAELAAHQKRETPVDLLPRFIG